MKIQRPIFNHRNQFTQNIIKFGISIFVECIHSNSYYKRTSQVGLDFQMNSTSVQYANTLFHIKSTEGKNNVLGSEKIFFLACGARYLSVVETHACRNSSC
jgi:hypothetical protein